MELVTSGLPTSLKPPMYGNGLACSATSWPAAPVPDRLPSTKNGSPNRTGFGTPAICSDSGTLAVLNVWSTPSAVPAESTATIR